MIYVFLADGFEEIEALATVDILRRADIEVRTVGVGGRMICGTHGIRVEADMTIDETVTDALDGVVLPGGLPGAWNLKDNKRVEELTRLCAAQGKLVAAICAAPSVLGDWGLLNGKRAVCYPGFEERLVGARTVDKPAVSDGNIVTGKGAGSATEFALEIVAKLIAREAADKIGEAMQCTR